jgi:hypothetical protein
LTDLIFRNAPPVGPSWELVFNESPDGRVVARVIGTMPDLTVSVEAQVSADVDATIAATMPGLTVSVVAFVDEAVPQYLTANAGAPWHDGASLPRPGALPWPASDLMMGRKQPTWRDATPFYAHTREPWGHSIPVVRSGTSNRWREASPSYTHRREPWRDLLALTRTGPSIRWREAERMGALIRESWRAALGISLPISEAWSDGLRQVFDPPLGWQRGRAANDSVGEPWRDGAQLVWHGGPLPPPVVNPPDDEVCYTPSPDLRFADLAPASTDLLFWCEAHPDTPDATVVVPTKKVYIVLNSFTLRRAEDDVPLNPIGASMSLDADSWTWGWAASLPLSDASLVEPDVDGTPVELIATLNGVEYRVLAERLSSERQFAQSSLNVSGRGIGAALDVLAGSYTNAESRTIAQLMEDVLTVNGVGGLDWTVDFGLEDWLVPAGLWNHQSTAIDALNALAGAGGAYLQPHPTDKVLRVLPRYPAAPWEWGTVTPDFELPSAVVSREGIEWTEKPRYTGVWVSGQSQGVLVQVKRTGTDGAVTATMVTDALITTTAAARQRGLPVLADTGRQAMVTLQLPVLPETGVIEPGAFVKYVDEGVERVGIVRGVNVAVALPVVTQTLEVEIHA